MSYLEKDKDLETEQSQQPITDDKECDDGICIDEKVLSSDQSKAIPPGVTVLELQFEFGDPPACTQPSGPYTLVWEPGLGYYYELNGVISVEGGDAIQPMFVYDSTLSGTLARGVLSS